MCVWCMCVVHACKHMCVSQNLYLDTHTYAHTHTNAPHAHTGHTHSGMFSNWSILFPCFTMIQSQLKPLYIGDMILKSFS